jgi:hypothetical protein
MVSEVISQSRAASHQGCGGHHDLRQELACFPPLVALGLTLRFGNIEPHFLNVNRHLAHPALVFEALFVVG